MVGDADEVIRTLGHLGGATVRIPDGERIPATGQDWSETNSVLEPSAAEISPAPLSGDWTEELAADFTASLDAVVRRVALCVWQAGTVGIHRRALCQRADLTPVELRALSMRIGRALARFQREQGIILSRPVAANSPLGFRTRMTVHHSGPGEWMGYPGQRSSCVPESPPCHGNARATDRREPLLARRGPHRPADKRRARLD